MLALSDFGTGAHGRFLTGVESDLASAMTTLTDG
jgi:hypothetical protein